ncbi:ABC transporter ATP-binding protein [Alloyangia pacifica]|uniref:Putative spermidine/putrescine transport system ATP-binding protein n=1 Tax=Alloyangia pacifica TaxID=311180 RepID=A0A1I6UPD2_9RHOB|nr:ABC transporter ATP-binding protein [Alloyangia pacifica]SDH77237.1 putative spermidine/putrescine transport system ATP-binding protein [Alloyangia pacifica]SFT03278.1 putative spermidine/putrescine transport system ATP-binding protein [Alloyangia pacifica]
MAQLTLKNLGKSFDATDVIRDLSLDVADGELVCLLGPSGSGKSTVLRMVGGFETPNRGAILIDGEDVTRVPPEKRPTGMVFQSHALWSHMSVAGNVAFGLKLRGLPKTQIREKVGEALALVGLEGYGERRVWQLSGGQQQRVAIARALVLEPKILLLDEPFASLDQHLRERLREELRDIQRRLGITTLFVTHGQDEALALADRIVVLRGGEIEQVASPDRMYRAPQTRFVAGFIGSMNFLPCDMRGGVSDHPLFAVRATVPDGPVELAIRPEALTLLPARGTGARVHRVTDYGTHLLVDVDLPDGGRLKAMCPPSARYEPGQEVALEAGHVALFRGDAKLAEVTVERRVAVHV